MLYSSCSLVSKDFDELHDHLSPVLIWQGARERASCRNSNEMEELFDYEYEDDMDVLREMEEETSNNEQRHLNSLKPSRVEPQSKKTLNFEIGEHESASFSSTEKNSSIVELKKFGQSSKKRGQEEKVEGISVLSDSHPHKKLRQHDSSELSKEMDSTEHFLMIEDPNSISVTDLELPQMLNSVQMPIAKPVASKSTNVSRKIPSGDFIAVTGTDGKRAYLSIHSDEELKKRVAHVCAKQNMLQLLSTPLNVLKVQAEEDLRMKELRHTVESQSRSDVEVDLETVENHNLWVDRYAPRRYTELLSNESINRGLLRWLKLWDFVVFGKENKTTTSFLNKVQRIDKKENKLNADKKPFIPSEAIDEHDQLKRPLFKLALVSGPPGLGKTTLAHIIAQHAGYNVVEMNASDDRSPEVFKEKIESATQMKAVLGADPRPNCLVIDEIDGAPQPAINILLSVIKKTEPANTKKRRKDGEILRRPIICICNDLYVPALRQLRQSAFLVTFYASSSSCLTSRLMEISQLEQLKTDLTTLFALCEKADNDIRSCINTLQFVKAQGNQLTLREVQTMSLGQKDSHKTLFNVWNHVFAMPKPSRKRYINPYDRDTTSIQQVEQLASAMAENSTSLNARFNNTLQIAMKAGEDSKVQQGLFENYLEAKVKDPHLVLVRKASEWLCFADRINQTTSESQNYAMIKYLPFLCVVFHFLFASNSLHKIIYPHSQFEFQTKLSKCENTISSMLADVVPCIRSNLNNGTLVFELLPLLCEVIQPTMRPVNTQLYSTREKEELVHLIDVMISYNLTYQQERSPDGQYSYKLEPNIEELIRFPSIKPLRQLNYATRQLVAREIDLEKLRRSENFYLKSNQKTVPSTDGLSETGMEAATGKKTLPNHQRQKLQPKFVNSAATMPTVDFFGRKIQMPAPDQAKVNATSTLSPSEIWFRFKEGYSNAVRRTVRIRDLL